MIARYLEQEEAVRQVISKDRKVSHLVISWKSVDALREVNAALSPLRDLTNVLSGDKYISVSMIIPMLSIVQDLCDEAKAEGSSRLTIQVLDATRAYMENRYDGDTRSLLHLCTILDPRYKTSFLRHDDEKEQYKIKLVNQLAELAPAPLRQPQQPASKDSTTELTVLCEPTKKKSIMDRLKEKTNSAQCNLVTNKENSLEGARREIENYLATPCLEMDSDPLKFWNSTEATYPLMARLARKLLCVPATSTTSE